MSENLISIINNQSKQLFRNTEFLFDYVDNQLLTDEICKWPLWRQLYHMLHSMDQWFINPYKYKDQKADGFGIAALNSKYDQTPLSKAELYNYYCNIKSKTEKYLMTLELSALSDYPDDSKFTGLDLLLGQFRHIMFHIGMIYGCILMKNGEIPNYVGLSEPVRPFDGFTDRIRSN